MPKPKYGWLTVYESGERLREATRYEWILGVHPVAGEAGVFMHEGQRVYVDGGPKLSTRET